MAGYRNRRAGCCSQWRHADRIQSMVGTPIESGQGTPGGKTINQEHRPGFQSAATARQRNSLGLGLGMSNTPPKGAILINREAATPGPDQLSLSRAVHRGVSTQTGHLPSCYPTNRRRTANKNSASALSVRMDAEAEGTSIAHSGPLLAHPLSSRGVT